MKSSFSVVQLRLMLQKMVFDKLKLEQSSFLTNIDQFQNKSSCHMEILAISSLALKIGE